MEQSFKLTSSHEIKEDMEGKVIRVISKNFDQIQEDNKTQFKELESQNKLQLVQLEQLGQS